MGLAEFSARVQEIRDMVNQRGIDLKSDKLEYEIAKRIAKHYNTLKQYDIVEILNEISDNLDSKLTVEENLAIVDNILGQYLKEDKYDIDYVESYEEALEHWNRQIAQELTRQYYEKEAENSVDWDKILAVPKKTKDNNLPIEISEKPQVNAKPKPKVEVIKYKPEIPEIAEIKEKVNALETQITLLDSKVTQLANVEKPSTDNRELIQRVERVEKDLNEIKEKLSQLEIAFNNILMGELRDIKAKVEELRKAEFKPVTVDNRTKPVVPEQEERPEDKIQRKIISIGREVTKVTLKAITMCLNMGLKAYIQGLNYMYSDRQKPSKRRVNKTVKM
jgi:outer membrane murein-binding lipoprotein Lpp